MAQATHMLPDELDSQILQADLEIAEPAALSESVARIWAGRNPDLIAIDPDAYRVAFGVALYLYRKDLKANRSMPMQSLGRPSHSRFAVRLAAAARDVFDAKDWALLGLLAFRAERANAAGSVNTDRTLGLIVSAFERLFESNTQESMRAPMLYGYLVSLPASLIVPRETLLAEGGKASVDWPILRKVWSISPEVWRTSAKALDALLKHPSFFVQDLAAKWKEAGAVQPAAAVKEKPIKNPFTGLAQGEGLKRPSAVAQQATAEPPPLPIRKPPKLFEQAVPTLEAEFEFEPAARRRTGMWGRFRNRFLPKRRRERGSP